MHQPPLVLVVDDNDVNRDILKTRLTASGYQVAEAADGLEALAVAAARLPDLILLDVMMPKLDGFEVCRRLKADPDFPYTPIILITAKSETSDIVTGLDAGADEYLTKPVNQKALVARVAAMLRVKALAERPAPQPHPAPRPTGTDIFVSYSRQDLARVTEIVHALTAIGWTVWWDRHLEAGTSFDRMIEDAIANARVVMVVWSTASVGSDWVRAEAIYGLERNKLVPVRIDQATLPLRFIQTHTLDLSAWRGGWDAGDSRRLYDDLTRALGPARRAADAAQTGT